MNRGNEAFKNDRVEQVEFRLLDGKKALKIISIGMGISLAATLAAYFF